jgi:DnaJ-class molecular chaperone
MNEKIPIPCEHCHGTGLIAGIECMECHGKGHRVVIGGNMIQATRPSTTLADFERRGIPESVFQ